MAAAFVQAASATFGSSAAQRSLAFGSNVTAGNFIVVAITTFFSSTVTVTVTDSQGQTYTQAGAYEGSGSNAISLWYIFNSLGGAVTVSYTPSTAAYSAIAIAEYSGMNVGTVDATANFAETNNVFRTAAVTSAVGDLVIGCYAQGTTNLSSCTGIGSATVRTSQLAGGSTDCIALADEIAVGSSTQPEANISASVAYVSIGASFTPGAVPAQTKAMPEIYAGPPLRGAPWAVQLPIQPAVMQAPPPAAPSPSFIISPEIKGGPPLRGAPWLLHLPVEPEHVQLAPGALPSGIIVPVYARETSGGPPLRGAPWANHLAIELADLSQAPQAPLPVGQSIPAPEISRGPPMRGAPWLGVLPVPPPTFSPSTAPPAPPAPPAPRPGQLAPLIPRDPVQDPRLRRITDMVSLILNSLIGRGQLLQTSPTNWTLAAGAFEVARAPGPADDSTVGATAGVLWIDTLSSAVYVCQSAAVGSAEWVLIGGGSGGLTGVFP